MGQSRYTNYVNDVREPDFATFLRICRVLDTDPNTLRLAVEVMDALAARSTRRRSDSNP